MDPRQCAVFETADMMTKLFLLAGQSNMEGAGLSSRLSEVLRKAPDNVRFFDEGKLRDLVWRARFGPEVGFAHEISASFPREQIVLCKVARSGSNLYYDWAPDRTSGGTEDEYRGPFYPKLLASLGELHSVLDARNKRCECAGLLWMQGERDAVFESMAESYEANLRAFIARVRADVNAPVLPFLIGLISPRKCKPGTSQSTHPYRDIVREAQARIADSMAHVAMVETMDLTQSDGLHFDAEGQVELGRRFAPAYRAVAKSLL
jgi:hypothetical protein